MAAVVNFRVINHLLPPPPTHRIFSFFLNTSPHTTYFKPSVDDDPIPRLVGIAGRRGVPPHVQADARVDEGQRDNWYEEGKEKEEDGVEAGAGVAPRLNALEVLRVVDPERLYSHVGVQGRRDGNANHPDENDQADLVGAQPGHRVERVEDGKVSAGKDDDGDLDPGLV